MRTLFQKTRYLLRKQGDDIDGFIIFYIELPYAVPRNAVLSHVKMSVKAGDIIGSASADKAAVDILVVFGGKVGQIFDAQYCSVRLVAGSIGGNSDIKPVLNPGKLYHSGNFRRDGKSFEYL